jgi:hypothetical protein
MFYADYQLALAIMEEKHQKAEIKRQLRANAKPSRFNLLRAFQARTAKELSQKKGKYGLQ